ncbi:MAG: TetR/AcrR family transcriptional regulator [Thermoleophilaceae bacterium]|nr:TetR/AcrR family transcriptional regulator [Thermoleophilaceae bacterium]
MEALTAPGAKAKRADAQRNRERILAAAHEVFADHGADASMEEVARGAAVGVGTLYRHFPTKRILLGGLLAERFRRFHAVAAEALASEPDPWEAFAGTLRRNAEMVSRDVAVQDALFRGDAAWEQAEEPRDQLIEVTAELIRRGQAAGVIRADLTVADVPMMMCGVGSTMANAYPDGTPMDWRRHLELLLDGVKPR